MTVIPKDQLEAEVTLHTVPMPGMSLDGKDSSTAYHLSVITLNRPKKLNAMAHDHYNRLRQLLDIVHADDATAATLLTGTGKFFSAGADFAHVERFSDETTSAAAGDEVEEGSDVTKSRFLSRFAAGNGAITESFARHRHPLFVALNGPAVGVSAAMAAFADICWAHPSAYLLTPFASLGLAPEAAASYTFPRKLGIMLANRALLGGEPIRHDDLVRCGFVSRTIDLPASTSASAPAAGAEFALHCAEQVVEYLRDRNLHSLRVAKELVRRSTGFDRALPAFNWHEAQLAADVFGRGVPQREFAKLKSGTKRHKL